MSVFGKIKSAFKNAFKKVDAKLDDVDAVVRPQYDTDGNRVRADKARTHTVVKGDTLSGISLKYYGDANKYDRIYAANSNIIKDADKIFPGQVLYIPADTD